MEQFSKIAMFIAQSFFQLWPYFLVTIPLAVVVKLSGASRYIKMAFSQNPVASIVLATVVGAFSPLCSCGIIPVIASLLIGGVPLAPVMSFWIASPSMDPEIFFLSTATLGWEMSVWRLAATFIISLSAGFITHLLQVRGFLGRNVLRNNVTSGKTKVKPLSKLLRVGISKLRYSLRPVWRTSVHLIGANERTPNVNCCVPLEGPVTFRSVNAEEKGQSCDSCQPVAPATVSFGRKVARETWEVSRMVMKFMLLAFLINAIVTFYVPQDFVAGLLGGNGSSSVIIATLVGIPVYTSNLTALPLISGLVALGMNPGAALAFLIAGPTTTLPAMVAVFGITKRKVFFLYVSFSLIGAVLVGFLYNIVG